MVRRNTTIRVKLAAGLHVVLGLLDWMEVLRHHLLVALPRLDHLRLGRRHPTREDGLANVAT